MGVEKRPRDPPGWQELGRPGLPHRTSCSEVMPRGKCHGRNAFITQRLECPSIALDAEDMFPGRTDTLLVVVGLRVGLPLLVKAHGQSIITNCEEP